MPYDITQLTVRPGTQPRALEALKASLPEGPGTFLACWFADIGPLNRIMVIREFDSEATLGQAQRAMVESENWLGAGEFVHSATSTTFVMLPFLPALQPGSHGPCFEVRDYLLKPGIIAANVARWEKALPARTKLSPVLACMYSAGGVMPRWLHVWPYKSLDERARVRGEAVKTGVWPPPSVGPDALALQENAIFMPVEWSPIK